MAVGEEMRGAGWGEQSAGLLPSVQWLLALLWSLAFHFFHSGYNLSLTLSIACVQSLLLLLRFRKPKRFIVSDNERNAAECW